MTPPVNPTPASSLPRQEKRWTVTRADNGTYIIVDDDGEQVVPLEFCEDDACAIRDAHNATLSEPKPEEKPERLFGEHIRETIDAFKPLFWQKEAPTDNAQAVLQKSPLERLVSNLADPIAWNWTRQGWDERSAADKVLSLMARLGLIQYRQHPLGGHIWEINGRIYGRTDGVAPSVVAGMEEANEEIGNLIKGAVFGSLAGFYPDLGANCGADLIQAIDKISGVIARGKLGVGEYAMEKRE